MRVLVTGGAGFIGSHIADRLLADGHEVRILDNLEKRVHPKGIPSYVSKEVEFIRGDIRSKSDVQNALKDVGCVFHQAAHQDYLPNYSTFMNVNVGGTALIYEVIEQFRYPVEKIVIASSQAVYGDGQYECKEHGFVQPPARISSQMEIGNWEVRCPKCGRQMKLLKSEERYANPYNQYALSKYGQELVALRLGKALGVPTVALRYSITQGPRQSLYNQYSGICRIFTLRLLNNKPPIIFEDGKQVRDYIHIDDVVEANMVVLDREDANYQAFNVGSGELTTVIEYSAILTRKLGKDIAPQISGEYRVGDNRHSVSNIKKLKEMGWAPKKSLDTIIDDYISWVGSQGDIADYFTKPEKIMKKMQVIKKARV